MECAHDCSVQIVFLYTIMQYILTSSESFNVGNRLLEVTGFSIIYPVV